MSKKNNKKLFEYYNKLKLSNRGVNILIGVSATILVVLLIVVIVISV